jgi:hypothetical protein
LVKSTKTTQTAPPRLKGNEMKVLSLFDGISCGRLALERAGIPVDVIAHIFKQLPTE